MREKRTIQGRIFFEHYAEHETGRESDLYLAKNGFHVICRNEHGKVIRKRMLKQCLKVTFVFLV